MGCLNGCYRAMSLGETRFRGSRYRNAAEADTLVAVELHRPVHEQPSADAGRSNPWGPARTLGIPISILIR